MFHIPSLGKWLYYAPLVYSVNPSSQLDQHNGAELDIIMGAMCSHRSKAWLRLKYCWQIQGLPFLLQSVQKWLLFSSSVETWSSFFFCFSVRYCNSIFFCNSILFSILFYWTQWSVVFLRTRVRADDWGIQTASCFHWQFIWTSMCYYLYNFY